ncbi:MAG: hypothetical protein ACRDZP_05135 [Acidimicrobiales bacterium]
MTIAVTLGVVALSGSACTAAVEQAASGPINVLKGTDVVVQTNLQAAVQVAQDQVQQAGSFTGFGTSNSPDAGIQLTPGASTRPSTVSYAVTSNGQGIVFASYNYVTKNCDGMIFLQAAAPTPILGENGNGQWDFVAPNVYSSACTASAFAASEHVPSGWPAGDPAPSNSGWPKP